MTNEELEPVSKSVMSRIRRVSFSRDDDDNAVVVVVIITAAG
jgi:hypothetical protein